MKLIFFGFISMIVLLNAYVGVRYTALAAALGVPVWVFRAAYALLVAAFFASIFFQDALLARPLLNDFVTYALTVYLGVFIFSLVGFFLIDLTRQIFYFLPQKISLPPLLQNIPARSVFIFFAALLVTFYGMWNAKQFVVKEYSIAVEKNAQMNPLNLVLLTDLHLGTAIDEKELRTLVERANALSPDVVCIAGDLYDHATYPRLIAAAPAILAGLRAPLGVYYVYGNHEYYLGNEREAVQGLVERGVRLLADECVFVGDSFYIAGRKDATAVDRLPLESLLADADRAKPLILMDHQPRELKLAAAAGVDLMLCGHTHAGQIWPFGLLTALFNEMLYGLREKDGFHAVVSSGAGVWRYPIRVGSKNEIVRIQLRFDAKEK